MKKNISAIVVFLFTSLLFAQSAEKATLAVTKISATPTLIQKVRLDGRGEEALNRILESMDSNLTAAILAGRKFELVSRSDIDAISKEIAFAESGNVAADKNAAKAGMIKGVKYILVVSVDDFQDYVEKASFESLGKTAEKRILRFGAVAKLIDSSTGSIKEATNFILTENDISDKSMAVSASGNLNDAIIAQMSRKMSEKISNRISDVIFPIRILAVQGAEVVVNRGENAGIEVGDMFDVFAQGDALIDPDTGENLGNAEFKIATVQIRRVNPKISNAMLVGQNGGLAVGQVLRLQQLVKTPQD